MKIWTVMGLVFVAFLVNGARAQSVDDFSPKGRAAFVGWNKCLAEYVHARTATAQRPEDIAKAALTHCEPQERIATDLLGKDFGAEGRASAMRYRSTFSANAVRVIVEARAGERPSNPLVAWGYCVGEATQKALLETQDDPVAIADKAMIDCQQLEQAARRAYASGNTLEDEKVFALSHKTVRDRAIELATSGRSGR